VSLVRRVVVPRPNRQRTAQQQAAQRSASRVQRCARGRVDRKRRARRPVLTSAAGPQTLAGAVAELGSAALQLRAATARLETVVAQLLAATRQLAEPPPRAAAAQPHACCWRAAVPYTSRRSLPARRSARRWVMPQA
jgi:hypothetical protein